MREITGMFKDQNDQEESDDACILKIARLESFVQIRKNIGGVDEEVEDLVDTEIKDAKSSLRH